MAAVVLNDGRSLAPDELEKFLATQPDLSPKAWPRFVRINAQLPQTATTKILKRALIQAGPTADGGILWERVGRGSAYVVVDEPPNPPTVSVVGRNIAKSDS